MTKKSNAVEIVSDFCKIKPCEIANTVAAQIFTHLSVVSSRQRSYDWLRCEGLKNEMEMKKSGREIGVIAMRKQVYISADYSETDGDKDVVDELNKWGNDDYHRVDFVDMSQVASGSVSKEPDCRICDLKAEFNSQINASSAVIFVVGNMTRYRTAGQSCGRVGKTAQWEAYCTPYKQNTNGTKLCKYVSTVPATGNNVGSINNYSYLRHEFEQAARQKKNIILDENYRSNQKIVDASVKIIQSQSPIVGKRELIVSRPLIAILYKKNQVQKLINCYSNILNEEGLLMNESRIIVRNNSVKNKILGKKVTTGTINTIEDFAHFVYLRKYNSLECFRGSTRVLARAIQRAFFVNEVHGNSNNLYKPERLESAEWNAIIVSVQKKLIADSAVTDLNKTWSAWKKTLASCLGNIDIIPSHTIELKSIRRGMKDEKVIDTFSNSIGHDISITIETIHGCKGMSLDSVLFVSSYTKSASSSGAHWRDWFQHNETGISEAHRLAYVAFSRAKHLLALGIPNPHSAPLSEADKQMLTDCGFEIVEIAEDRS